MENKYHWSNHQTATYCKTNEIIFLSKIRNSMCMVLETLGTTIKALAVLMMDTN